MLESESKDRRRATLQALRVAMIPSPARRGKARYGDRPASAAVFELGCLGLRALNLAAFFLLVAVCPPSLTLPRIAGEGINQEKEEGLRSAVRGQKEAKRRGETQRDTRKEVNVW